VKNNFFKCIFILPHYYFFLDSLFQTQICVCEMHSLEAKQSGGKLLQHSDLRKGVFLGEISSNRLNSKKDCKEKKKEEHSCKIGTWNIRTLNRGGKLGNLKKEIQNDQMCVVDVSEVR